MEYVLNEKNELHISSTGLARNLDVHVKADSKEDLKLRLDLALSRLEFFKKYTDENGTSNH